MTSWLYINTRARMWPRGKTVLTAALDLQTEATEADADRFGRHHSLLTSGIYCLVKVVASPSETRPPSPTSPRSSLVSPETQHHPLANSQGLLIGSSITHDPPYAECNAPLCPLTAFWSFIHSFAPGSRPVAGIVCEMYGASVDMAIS